MLTLKFETEYLAEPVKGSVPCWKTAIVISTCSSAWIHKVLTDEVLLGRRVALVLGEVVEEELDVGVEAELPGSVGRDEAEDLHVAVGADEEVPFEAGNGDGRDLGADGPDAADAGEP
jgi:hypothetical protein